MAAKKKSKKNTASTAPAGRSYTMTSAGKKALETKTKQPAIIRDAIAKAGSKGITARELVAKVGSKLKSSTAAKNIAFYLAVWTGDGFLAAR